MWKAKTKSRINGYGVAKIKQHTYNSVSGMSAKSGAGWWEIRNKVWKRDGGMCVPCRRLGKLVEGKEVHHIIPLSKNGTTSMANLMTVCEVHHNKRHTHLFRSR